MPASNGTLTINFADDDINIIITLIDRIINSITVIASLLLSPSSYPQMPLLFYLLLLPIVVSTRLTLPLTIHPPRHPLPSSRLFLPSTPHPFLSRILGLPHYSVHPISVDLLGGITRVGEYYTRILIGNQPVRVQIDTGSSTLALPLAECDRCLPSDQRYNPRSSTSGAMRWVDCVNPLCRTDVCEARGCKVCSSNDACCADENPQVCGFELKYGDGSLARGGLMVDEMTWGNVSAKVVFGGILHDSQDFERPMVDGILGMGYEALACNPTCVEPPFQQMVKAGVVEDEFSICITQQGGKLVLGQFDPSLAKTEMKYVDLALSDPPTFYTFNISNTVGIGDRLIEVPNLRSGILDSGTTLIVVSRTTFLMLLEALTKFHCDVPGLCDTDEPWFMPTECVEMPDDMLKKLPTFKFKLGAHQELDLEIRPEDYMLKPERREKQGYRCVGIMAMQEMQEGSDIILGNTVMQRYVSHYDRKNKRLGFAEASEGCGSSVRCSSNTACDECAMAKGCSFNFRTQKCQTERSGLGLIPYPMCTGDRCLCKLGRQADIVFGILGGVAGSIAIVLIAVFVAYLYGRRGSNVGVGGIGRGGDREPVYTIDGEEEEDDSMMESGRERTRPGKEYMPVPTE